LGKDDTSFLQKLKDEIPAFLYHLQHRNLTTKEESRMWFSPSLIRTDALEKIIRCNRSRIELDMAELLLDIMTQCWWMSWISALTTYWHCSTIQW